MNLNSKTIFIIIGIGVCGWAFGQFIRFEHPLPSISLRLKSDSPIKEAQHESGSSNILTLSDEAIANLNLKMERIQLGTFNKLTRFPGEIIEYPGRSSIQVAANISGIVKELLHEPGESLRPGEPLFRIQIIDDDLIQVQRDTLELLTELEVTTEQIARLKPLAENRAIQGDRVIQFENQQKQIEKKLDLKRQELIVRGLEPTDITTIFKTKKMIRDLTIKFDNPANPASPLSQTDSPKPIKPSTEPDNYDYSLEKLYTRPGSTIKRGENLCEVSYHRQLLVKAYAFEQDVPMLLEAQEAGKTVSFEYGPQGNTKRVKDQPILFVDNHVDESSKTFPFYIRLENRVIKQRDAPHGFYRNWKYKPGQQIHISVVTSRNSDVFVLPASAIVEDGIESVVFRQLPGHEHPGIIELEPIKVQIISRDAKFVALSANGKLTENNNVVTNEAYKVQLAFNMQKEEGSGHSHHGHEH